MSWASANLKFFVAFIRGTFQNEFSIPLDV